MPAAALDEAWLARIAALPRTHTAAFDFEESIDTLGAMELLVTNETSLSLVFTGGEPDVGFAVNARVPIAPAVAGVLVGGGETGWVEPLSPAVLRSARVTGTTSAPIERLAIATDSRGLAHAVIVTGDDVVHVFGQLVTGCATVDSDNVRAVVAPPGGSLCAEVLAL
jgi:hypothetical protein